MTDKKTGGFSSFEYFRKVTRSGAKIYFEKVSSFMKKMREYLVLYDEVDTGQMSMFSLLS